VHRAQLQTIAVIAAASIVAVIPAAPAFASSSPSVSANVATVGSAPSVPYGAHALGATPLSNSLSFDVVLKPRNQAALDSFVQALSTPGSPQYRQFLAPGQYDSTFGPTPQAIANVKGQLEALGLQVGSVTGSVISVSGTIAKVGSALHTSFTQYKLASGRLARANTSAPEFPTTVAPLVQSVVGLDDLASFTHPLPKSSSGTAAPLAPHALGPAPCAAASATPGTPYTADEIATRYGLNAFYSAGNLGSGVTVALFELEPFDPSDVAAYQACYGTSASISTVDVDGGPGTGPGEGEAALDIEDIIGLAPQANIDVYQGPSAAGGSLTEGNVYDTYNQIAVDDTAQVVSTSWGVCEPDTDPALASAESDVFAQMAAQGQTMFAASGDAGSADCDAPAGTDTELAVDDPASQPYVTGVGGTELPASNGTETTWNDGVVGSYVWAGGGGKSIFWSKPSWQPVSGSVREVPDVSASADPDHGYAVYYAGSWIAVGGTSAAAPTWASLAALIDSSCVGHKLGFINPALYQLESAGGTQFNDVTTGNNDGAGAHGGVYAAGNGYDMATGLGTPVGAALNTALCPSAIADGAGAMAVNPSSVAISTSKSLTFTYTAPVGQGLENGTLSLSVPADWSAPSTTSTARGYTTSSDGVVSVSGTTITVAGVTVIGGGTVTITYGDKSGGGVGALIVLPASASRARAAPGPAWPARRRKAASP